MTTTGQDRYNIIPVNGLFARALVCHRCGVLVPHTGDPEGAARELHDLFHEQLDAPRRAALDKPGRL